MGKNPFITDFMQRMTHYIVTVMYIYIYIYINTVTKYNRK